MNGAPPAYVADTSVIIGLVRRDQKTLAAVNGKQFSITFISVAELYLGVLKTIRWQIALDRLAEVMPDEEVLYPSEETPVVYAKICHDLERRDVRIPSNDIWIAALAVENKLPLLARDKHFARVRGLESVPC